MKPSINAALKIMKTGAFPANGVIDLKDKNLGDKEMDALTPQLCSSRDGQTVTYNLSGNHFTERGLQQLWYAVSKASFSSPVIFDLTHTQLNDRAIMSLAYYIGRFPPFVTLKLGQNDFKDISPLTFALGSGKYPPHFTLDLTGFTFSYKTAQQLKTALAKAPEDFTLNLSHTGMKDESGKALLEAFQSLKYPKKQTLILSFNELTSQSVRILAQGLAKQNATHQLVINLEGNQLKSEGLIAFSAILTAPDAPCLTLNLRNNGIKAEGVKALAHALSSGKVPEGTCIDLGKNILQDQDLDELWAALQSKKCPRHLTLLFNDNKLGKKTLATLAKIAHKLPIGISLGLADNGFTKDAIKEFISEIQGKVLPFSLHLEINSSESKKYQKEQQEIDTICSFPLQVLVNFLTILQGQAQENSPLSLVSDEMIRHIFSFVAPKEELSRIAKLHDQASNKLYLIKNSGFFKSSQKAEGQILAKESKNTPS